MNLQFLPAAEAELMKGIGDYEDLEAGLGDRFLQEVGENLQWILEHPEGARLRRGFYRRVNLRTFPWHIAYLTKEDTIFVLALAHSARRPLYWASRRNLTE